MARLGMNRKKMAIISSIVVSLLAIGAAALVLLKSSKAFPNLPEFPVDSYMEGSALWVSDECRMEARVDNVILPSTDGQKLLISVQPKGSGYRLPILISKNGATKPIQREQQLVLKVSTSADRQLRCTEYEVQ